jgi:putative transposase
MENLVATLGITRLSKSQVSVMARELDEQVANFRSRPLDQGPYTFLAVDALTMKVREGGRLVLVHLLIATGMNGDGHREVIGVEVTSAEDGAGRLGFFRDLVAGGLSGPWLPPMPTPGWSRPSVRRCPVPPGNAVAPTTPQT